MAVISAARRGEARRSPVGYPLQGPAVDRGEQHRREQHDQDRQRQPDTAGEAEQQEDDQRDEGADHEDFAMGEIDHADDAVDHRVTDGDQAVDRPERDAVDQLIEEIGDVIHGLAQTLRAAPPGRRPPVCDPAAETYACNSGHGGYRSSDTRVQGGPVAASQPGPSAGTAQP